MATADIVFLRGFFQSLEDRPLDPANKEDSLRYVPMLERKELASSDPVAELQSTIEWSSRDSTQLFSGFRGTGKSTELRRLKKQLEATPNTVVVICDMAAYLNLSTPVDLSDFLLSIAGAFGEALPKHPALQGVDVVREGYFTRFVNFLTRTRVDISELGVSVEPAGVGVEVKANLKADPSFRQKLQEKLKGHLGALVADVHGFFGDCVKAIRAQRKEHVRVVALFDSIEQIRGSSVNMHDVTDSLELLFHGHADKLHIPDVDVIYTVPPWLKIKTPGVASLYDGFQLIPCVKVRTREGEPWPEGLDALEQVISRRGDWRRLFDSRETLNQILIASGGHLRDLFRILQAVTRLTRNETLPTPPRVVDLALHEVRNSYLPLPLSDARWLARIEDSRCAQLDEPENLPDLSRFFDTHLVLTYRNGQEWYAVHPLLADEVKRQVLDADAYLAKQAPSGSA